VRNGGQVRNSGPYQKPDTEHVDQISCETVDENKRKSQKTIKYELFKIEYGILLQYHRGKAEYSRITLKKKTGNNSMLTWLIGKSLIGDDSKSHLKLDDMMVALKQQRWVRPRPDGIGGQLDRQC
jgi:hypothetical protein